MNKMIFFSFGFSPTATTVTSGVTHLQNQVYDICFRRASGYCYICYVSYFCNLIWWLTFWTLIIPICAPSKTVKGKRKKKNKKKEESFDWKVRRGITKLHRPKVLPSSPWEVTRVWLPGKNFFHYKIQGIMTETIGEPILKDMKMRHKSMITGREESVNYAENRIQIWFFVRNYHYIFLSGEM